MMSRETLAKGAVHAALRLRSRLGRRIEQAVCPYDLVEEVGVSLRFMAVPSLEGMYQAGGRPMVIVNSLRPTGRRAFNCAHELGHHAFNHGTCVDELIGRGEEEERRDPKEFIANRFAAALLMPKVAVERAFFSRGWEVRRPTPEQAYVIAGYLGVGYATLVRYLQGTLELVSPAHAKSLLRIAPKDIRCDIAGTSVPHDLVVVDDLWDGRPIDVEVDDYVQLPAGCVPEGALLSSDTLASPRLVCAVAPGVSFLSLNDRTCRIAIRIARREFAGLGRYRYLEESDD